LNENLVVLITNQSGIRREYFGENDLREVHEKIDCGISRAERQTRRVVATHNLNDDCDCHQAEAGMIRQAVKISIDLKIRGQSATKKKKKSFYLLLFILVLLSLLILFNITLQHISYIPFKYSYCLTLLVTYILYPFNTIPPTIHFSIAISLPLYAITLPSAMPLFHH